MVNMTDTFHVAYSLGRRQLKSINPNNKITIHAMREKNVLEHEKPAAHSDSMGRNKGCLHAQLQADIAHRKHNVPGIPRSQPGEWGHRDVQEIERHA